MRLLKKYGDTLLLKELKASYHFFIKEANVDSKSRGYGLIKDKDMYADEIASIASVGYGLAALVIGANRNWISYPEAYRRASKTLDTFLNYVEGENGFYYHFVNMHTGRREWNCEISIIDTAIFICGAILAGEYFRGKIKQKAEELYKRVNWEWYRNKESNYFYMGYKPENGFIDGYNLENGQWYSKEVIGIDKGISMMMIENYLSQLLWKQFMKNEYVQKGLEILNISKKNENMKILV